MQAARIFPDHLYEPARLELAQQIMQKELRKLFPDLGADAYSKLDASVRGWAEHPARYHLEDGGVRDFWDSFAAVMEGIKLKPRFSSLITAGNYPIERQAKLAVAEIRLTSPFVELQRFKTLKVAVGTRFGEIAEAMEREPAEAAHQRQIIARHSQSAEQNAYPVIVHQGSKGLSIMDGNRRCLLAVAEKRPTIDAWVITTNNQQPQDFWVSVNDLYLLVAMYRHAKDAGQAASAGPVLRQMLELHFKQSRIARINFDTRIRGENPIVDELYAYPV